MHIWEVTTIMDINTIDDGALKEQFDIEVSKVIKNMSDPNVQEKAKRSITIRLDFVPDNTGSAGLQYSVKSTLSGQKARNTRVVFGLDADGTAIIQEIPKGVIAGQVMFAPPDESNQDNVANVNLETGEILEKPVTVIAGGLAK